MVHSDACVCVCVCVCVRARLCMHLTGVKGSDKQVNCHMHMFVLVSDRRGCRQNPAHTRMPDAHARGTSAHGTHQQPLAPLSHAAIQLVLSRARPQP